MEVNGAIEVPNTTTNSKQEFLNKLLVNHQRISDCCDRLALHLRTAPQNDTVEFCNTCLSLARGIGYAIASKEIPNRSHELPLLLKQVCHKLGNGAYLHAAVLVLMISVKSACANNWFSDEDSKGLCAIANQIMSSFCSSMNFNTEPNSFLSTISTIMSRYYPKMKMGKILAFLELKPGYETCIHDFLISTDTKPSSGERARLFVAQLDDTNNSSCLVTPTQANFLLNGRGVDGRNNVIMDTGPQMPTHVYHLLRYGSNLLQAIGQFNGNYIVVVAFMSVGSTPDYSTLQDYEQSTLSMVDTDSELIEGPSRISLNCPISFKRIKVPVKGHICKHRQCFDYENYMEINSKRPSWRCPHCNQNVCFSDIRIDQNMAKVLKEVNETINEVIISSDGSWKAIMENNNNPSEKTKKPLDNNNKTHPPDQEAPESSEFSNGPNDIMDLTVDDYEIEPFNICEPVSGPHHSDILQLKKETNELLPKYPQSPQVDDNFWSGICLPLYGPGGVPPQEANTSPSPSPNSDSFLQGPFSPLVPRRVTNVRPVTSVQRPVISSSISTQTSPMGISSFRGNMEMQQLYFSNMNSSASHHYPRTQARSQSPSSSYRVSPEYHQQPYNQRAPLQITQMRPGLYEQHQNPPLSMRAGSSPSPSSTLPQFTRRPWLSPSHNIHSPRFPSPSMANNSPVIQTLRPVGPTGDDNDISTPTQDWRPSGRMRGSLSGSAYSDAFDRFITQPTQQGQSVRPSPNVTSR